MANSPTALPIKRPIPFPVFVAASGGVMLIAAFIELKMGRLLMCKCGYIKFWVGKNDVAENSQQIADWYSFSHIIHGFIFYGLLHLLGRGRLRIGPRLLIATFIECCWEVVENSSYILNYYRSETISWGYTGDTVVNSMSDILFALLGFTLARYLPVWLTVCLLLVMEITCAIVMRDNLLLNILMFIHPFQGIKHWQAAG